MIYAVIPAAGHSRRMGCPKLSLPLGNHPILHWVIAGLNAAGIADILVIGGPHGLELSAIAEAAGAHFLRLENDTADMRETVTHGLNWLENRFHPKPDDAWLLVPADHPTLSAEMTRQVIEAYLQKPEFSICIPIFNGVRGHPTLIAWRHVPAIKSMPIGDGLNRFLRSQRQHVREIPVDSSAVLEDLDTPEDYEKLVRSWNSGRTACP
ncbi:MAG: NTP transferase domain-containing protein [Gemmataceae bacterium]